MQRKFAASFACTVLLCATAQQFAWGAAVGGPGQKPGNAPSAPPPQIDKSMSVQKAIQIIETGLHNALRGNAGECLSRQPLQQILVTRDGFQFLDIGKMGSGGWTDDYSVTAIFRFKDMPYLQIAAARKGPGTYTPNWPKPVMLPTPGYGRADLPTRVFAKCVGEVSLASNNDWAAFVAAINRLIWEQSDEAAQERVELQQEFTQKAAEWRALVVKPAMPEDARVHKVLAENAVQEHNSGKAMEEYAAALAIFPSWPEGQFNLALLCGESGDYAEAVWHMKAYLELVPDAQDAQAAKDKIIVWQDKIDHP